MSVERVERTNWSVRAFAPISREEVEEKKRGQNLEIRIIDRTERFEIFKSLKYKLTMPRWYDILDAIFY